MNNCTSPMKNQVKKWYTYSWSKFFSLHWPSSLLMTPPLPVVGQLELVEGDRAVRHPGLTRRRRFAVEECVAVWQRITSSGDHPLGAAMNPLRSCPSTGEYIIFSLSVSRHTIYGNLMIEVHFVKIFERMKVHEKRPSLAI